MKQNGHNQDENCCGNGHEISNDTNHSSHTTMNQDKHSAHNDRGSHADHMSSPGMAQAFLKKFYYVTFLLLPLLFFSEAGMNFLGYNNFVLRKWLVFALGTYIFWFARIFFQHASHEIKAKQYGMMTLVAMGVGAGFLFSAVTTFIPSLEVEFYLEVSTLIWVLLFGHYLEAKSSSAAGDAMQEVAKLLPKQAHLITQDSVRDVDIAKLKTGNLIMVKPGEKVPADGEISKGSAHFNESHISGESKPINKGQGDEVVAGAICEDGTVEIVLNRVGAESTIGQIQQLIAKAQVTKPSAQRIADKASRLLTFGALLVAILTLLVWTFIVGEPFVFAITLAITVLVIACPHALGLAIPTVSTIATRLSVENGIFVKDMAKLEIIKGADYVMFDKTGTLTEGNFGVTDVSGADMNSISTREEYFDEKVKEALSIVMAIEMQSSHVIADSIVKFAKKLKLKRLDVENFKNLNGRGVSATVNDVAYWLGSPGLIKEKGLFNSKIEELHKKLASQGKTVIYLANEKEVLGVVALADQIRVDSKQAIDALHELNVKVAMLTGDNKVVAKGVADELNIDNYFAEVLPEDKYKHIKALQDKGNKVIMVGDGVNDAPALTQADVGVAIGAGTEVAVEAGDAVLIKDNPNDIAKLIILSRKVYRKMIENLVWALGYNVLAIPAAAGVFVSFGFRLSPGWGALMMSLSSVIVVINAMTLRKVKLVS
jgi:Cu2+-exporting ATPase